MRIVGGATFIVLVLSVQLCHFWPQGLSAPHAVGLPEVRQAVTGEARVTPRLKFEDVRAVLTVPYEPADDLFPGPTLGFPLLKQFNILLTICI